MKKHKRAYFVNRPKLYAFIGAFLLLSCVILIIISSLWKRCTWNESKIPQLPHLPDSSSLISEDNVWKRGYFRGWSAEYEVTSYSREELITFFEEDAGATCWMTPSSDSIEATCSGQRYLGSYYVNIYPSESEQQPIIFVIILE